MIAKITGRGEFPIDMLRYDQCSPATEVDSGLIEQSMTKYGSWEIYVKTNLKPTKLRVPAAFYPWTKERWESFGVKIEPLPSITYPPSNRMAKIDDRPLASRN